MSASTASQPAGAPSHPGGVLMNLIITLLTPMFLAAAGNNLAFARQAAMETVNAYRAETQSDLITVAKIIGFGLAALAAISLSMAEDLPIATILRLHASATASDRSEHRNRQVLKQRPTQRPQAAPEAAPEPDIDEAALTAAAADMKVRTAEHLATLTRLPAASTAAPAGSAPASATPAPAASYAEKRYFAAWAASAAAIASETAAALPDLPPDERRTAAIWVDVLNDCAKDFIAGDTPTRLRPGDLAGMMPPRA